MLKKQLDNFFLFKKTSIKHHVLHQEKHKWYARDLPRTSAGDHWGTYPMRTHQDHQTSDGVFPERGNWYFSLELPIPCVGTRLVCHSHGRSIPSDNRPSKAHTLIWSLKHTRRKGYTQTRVEIYPHATQEPSQHEHGTKESFLKSHQDHNYQNLKKMQRDFSILTVYSSNYSIGLLQGTWRQTRPMAVKT